MNARMASSRLLLAVVGAGVTTGLDDGSLLVWMFRKAPRTLSGFGSIILSFSTVRNSH